MRQRSHWTAGRAWSRSPRGKTTVRYLAVSALSVVLGQVALALAFGGFGWSAKWSNLFGFIIAAFPSYYLNRIWAWGKTGRSHFVREVLPFWIIAFLGLAFSTVAVDIVEHRTVALAAEHSAERTGLIMAASLGACVVLWALKFMIFQRYLFGSAVPRPSRSPTER